MTVCPCRAVTVIPSDTGPTLLVCTAAWWHTGDHQCYHVDRLIRWRNLDQP